MSFLKIEDRVALIVGVANPIGEAIGLRLGKAGASIILVDENADQVNSIVKKLTDAGVKAEGKAINMKDAKQVEDTVNDIANKHGKIDILINGIDYMNCKSLSDMSIEDWNSSIENNLLSVFLFTKYVVPKMQEKKYGRIVNISDLTYLGFSGTSNYSAAKSGIFGFTRALALELAKDQITVNTVIKGDIDLEKKELSEEELKKATAGIPVQRLGTPEDVAFVVSYFVSDTSSYTTGQMLFVCGGKSIYASMSI